MIYVVYSGFRPAAGHMVYLAFCRAFSRSQVGCVSPSYWSLLLKQRARFCVVLVNPLDEWFELVESTCKTSGVKIVVFGEISDSMAALLSVEMMPLSNQMEEASRCQGAPPHDDAVSPGKIVYRATLDELDLPIPERPLVRYDFLEEWNNLGYGAIKTDGSIWSLAQQAKIPKSSILAEIQVDEICVGAYCGKWDFTESSLLWFNRAVGPIDSHEWRLVEYFLSTYRAEHLHCQPVLLEVPYGYDAAVTMRIDCDEDIASIFPLYDSYREWRIPFSLAIHTSNLACGGNRKALRTLHRAGVAVLSHSATHPENWGGNYDNALQEATRSARELELATGVRPRYAVSPFHQNPHYAVKALADAGYQGCIGGLIGKDPEYLVSRGGRAPGASADFVIHSQQCMLHGDSIGSVNDPVTVYKQAFDQAQKGRAIFGYLDHPFSDRYQYGWESEHQRADIHSEFIQYIKSRGKVLFLTEVDAMDRLYGKEGIELSIVDEGVRYQFDSLRPTKGAYSMEYKGKIFPIASPRGLI